MPNVAVHSSVQFQAGAGVDPQADALEVRRRIGYMAENQTIGSPRPLRLLSFEPLNGVITI